jgi:hypothetical protein
MIVLSLGHESGGRTLVLDVMKGNIHEEIIRCMNIDGETIEDFFEKLRTRFEKLELVPTPEEVEENEESIGEDWDGGDELQEYRRIYREFGWSGEGYRKEEALVKIRECREREHEEDKLGHEERKRQSAENGKV